MALRVARAPVAQWIERRPSKPRVGGSNPLRRTIRRTVEKQGASSYCALEAELPDSTPIVALFDIDGTLVRTEGPSRHSRAFKAAFQQVYGAECTFAVGMHGMTDLQIFMLLAKELKVGDGRLRESAVQACRSMVEIYGSREDGDGSYVVLPGVRDLLSTLSDYGVALGLITGNVPEIARDKLESTGLDRFFGFGAFGSEGDDRTMLPPLAVARAEFALGALVDPRRVFVIGDTPRDVLAAVNNGYRPVAVATGHISFADLSATGADLVLQDLTDPASLLDLMDLGFPRSGKRDQIERD